MRELKFRAWDVESECYIDEKDWAGITPEGRNIWIVEEEEVSVLPILGEFIIEQYTGLKDKNGKEIYEGDIVKYKLYADSRLDYIDEVFYSTISGAFMVGDEDNIRTLDCLINVEVIGNIHENPELLGGEE